MANALINPSIIAKEALMQLKNNLVMGKCVHREYKNEFRKVGDSVSIRRPVKFLTSDGATRVAQDVQEGTTSIVINQRKHVSFGFSTQDLTLTVEEYSERYIKPAMITLANTVDKSLMALYSSVWNYVGTPGSTPDSFADVALVSQRMDEMAVPDDGERKLVMNPAAGYKIAGTALSIDNGGINRQAYRTGQIGEVANLMTYRSQNIKTHTTGTHTTGSTPLVNGGSQGTDYATSKSTNTQSLVTDGWANSTAVLKAGDIINIAGVFAVNPVPGEGASNTATKETLPYLQDFVVTADATSNGSGQATLTISPPMITTGAFQTVSAEPADNAAITVKGTEGTGYAQNMGFHKNAFALVTCPLEMPDGVAFKAREQDDGLSVRVVKDYDIDSDEDIIRLDVLYGVKAIYPELAVRLTG